MKNKYFIRSRISEAKFREIIKLFSGDLTACQIALFSGVSRMCVNRILKQVRIRIAEFCEQESIFKNGEVEMDESYFCIGPQIPTHFNELIFYTLADFSYQVQNEELHYPHPE